MTLDRHLLGDAALAMMLVLPTAAIAGTELPIHRQAAPTLHSSAAAKAAPAERTMAERGVGLLG